MMYAKANSIQITSPEAKQSTSVQPRRQHSTRGLLSRFANWFGSGSVDTSMLKAGHGHGSTFMLVNGQIVVTPSCREATGADNYTM